MIKLYLFKNKWHFNMLFIVTLFLSVNVCAQYHISTDINQPVQFGISAKATLEFQKGGVQTRLGFTAGVGKVILGNAFYPSFNAELELYQGGLGTKSGSGQNKSNFTADLIGAFLLTGGAYYRGEQLTPLQMVNRNQPLFYFTDMVQPALQNPYRYSLSVGTNYVIPFDHEKSSHQRVGFINVHAENFQFGYYNDGGGFQSILIGDGEDRYYTGGGLVAVTFPANDYVNTVVASYNKFSGFGKHSFDLSSSMGVSYVSYRNPSQQYYNKSYWSISLSNVKTGLNGFVRINNTYNRFDFQNTIHYSFSYAYHQIPYPRYISWGLSYFNSLNNIAK